MGRKVFISFLGTTNYTECHYELDGKRSVATKFIQEALIDFLCDDWSENDEIIIFGTEKDSGSIKKNWFDGGHPDDSDGSPSKGLKSILESKNIKAKLNNIIKIPEGFSEMDFWEIFDTVYNKLEDNDEIYFDATHAFRSIPLFSTTLFNYSKLLKQTKLKSIYYGAFEKLFEEFGSRKDIENISVEQRIAPVLNLSALVQLNDWVLAAGSFLDYGKTNKIHELLETEYSVLNKKYEGKNWDSKNLEKLDKELSKHSESILSNNLSKIIHGTDAKKYLEEVKNSNDIISQPFVPLLEKIDNKLEKFNQDDLLNIFAATDWCIEHELYQNAYSILLEGTVSIILIQINETMDLKNILKDIEIRKIPIHISSIKNQNKKESEDKITKEKAWLKFYSEEKEELKQIFYLVWDILDDDIAGIINTLAQYRNKYMHAGTGKEPLPENFEVLKKNIEECNQKLKNWYFLKK